jgi:hypothetical protein
MFGGASLLRCEIAQQGSPRGQGPPRFGYCELAQQADEPQMGKTIWGLFYVWGVSLLRCEIAQQGSPRGGSSLLLKEKAYGCG